ncbi:TIGR04211 family SH3 domain-containing protein [Maricurvus nonylphenolicus]|uniref:TIGR04211 family SH3 domain-containing protein n=1 Tax=Maricurvus nonylphenolicus TaxID=1008307 RepID=UPI0036F236B5
MTNKLLLSAFLSAGLALSGLTTPAAYAADRWVSDVLYVPLRSGKGNQFRIVNRGLKTGTPLTLIEEDVEGGWVFVETETGEQGWVRSQYVINEPTASIHLNNANSKIASLDKQRKQLQTQVKDLKSENRQLNKELNKVSNKSSKLDKELSTIKQVSSSAIDLHERHQELMHQHQLIQTELDVLKAENSRLKADSRNTFFIYGALAVGLGVLITLIVPNLRRRKRYSEWA